MDQQCTEAGMAAVRVGLAHWVSTEVQLLHAIERLLERMHLAHACSYVTLSCALADDTTCASTNLLLFKHCKCW